MIFSLATKKLKKFGRKKKKLTKMLKTFSVFRRKLTKKSLGSRILKSNSMPQQSKNLKTSKKLKTLS